MRQLLIHSPKGIMRDALFRHPLNRADNRMMQPRRNIFVCTQCLTHSGRSFLFRREQISHSVTEIAFSSLFSTRLSHASADRCKFSNVFHKRRASSISPRVKVNLVPVSVRTSKILTAPGKKVRSPPQLLPLLQMRPADLMLHACPRGAYIGKVE